MTHDDRRMGWGMAAEAQARAEDLGNGERYAAYSLGVPERVLKEGPAWLRFEGRREKFLAFERGDHGEERTGVTAAEVGWQTHDPELNCPIQIMAQDGVLCKRWVGKGGETTTLFYPEMFACLPRIGYYKWRYAPSGAK